MALEWTGPRPDGRSEWCECHVDVRTRLPMRRQLRVNSKGHDAKADAKADVNVILPFHAARVKR